MSVINQMLRDLDAREASAKERAGLPSRLRPLPQGRRSRFQPWHMLLIGLGLGGLLTAAVFSLYQSGHNETPAVPPPVAAVAPPPPPAPPAMPAELPKKIAPTAMPASAKESAPAKERSEMKLATQLASPAKPSAPVEQKPATPAKPAAAAEAPLAAETQIDKRNSGGQAQEMAEAEYRKGLQAVKRGENNSALQPLQRALELDPQHVRARQTLLSVLVGGRHWPDAQRVAQAGLALDPTQAGWAAILARLQFEQGDTPAALQTLERYAAHAGSNAEYQGLFAYLLQKQQRFAEAAQHFQAALAQRPQEGRWWFGLAVAFENSGKAGEAREAYAKAREVGNLSSDMATVVDQKLK